MNLAPNICFDFAGFKNSGASFSKIGSQFFEKQPVFKIWLIFGKKNREPVFENWLPIFFENQPVLEKLSFEKMETPGKCIFCHAEIEIEYFWSKNY